jgi:hypothetical protein
MASTLTELEAVNKVLRAVGEAPVSSVDSQNPYAVSAREIIKEKNKDIQSQGWWFNTQRDLKLSPDLQKYIGVPSNTLAIHQDEEDGYLAVRGDSLFNLKDNTFFFEEPVVIDIIEMVNFDYLPFVASKVITASAAVEMQRAYEMDRYRLDSLSQEYQMAYMELKKHHYRNVNINSLNSPQATRLLGGGIKSSGNNPNLIGG